MDTVKTLAKLSSSTVETSVKTPPRAHAPLGATRMCRNHIRRNEARMPKIIPLRPEQLLRMRWRPEKLGESMRAKRVSLGLSQQAVAEEIGVHRQTISDWENGQAPATVVRLVSWLLSDDVESSREEMWRWRAQRAEAALRDVTTAIVEYRARMKDDLAVADGASSQDSA